MSMFYWKWQIGHKQIKHLDKILTRCPSHKKTNEMIVTSDQSEAVIKVTWSSSANHRPVLAGTSPGAGIWDRYTIIHWKRPESNSSQTDFWGTFQVYPLKPDPDGSQFIHRPVVCRPISFILADQQSLLSPPLPAKIWSFTSFTIVWTNSWPGPQ